MSREPFPVDHPVLTALVSLAGEGWRGTASKLWVRLEELGVDELPVDGQRLANRLRGSTEVLADLGVRVRRSRRKGERMLTVETITPAVEEPVVAPADEAPRSNVLPLRVGEDRIAGWSVGHTCCPECFTDLRDPNLARNRRALGLAWYPDAHTYRACRYERSLAAQLEDDAGRQGGLGLRHESPMAAIARMRPGHW